MKPFVTGILAALRGRTTLTILPSRAPSMSPDRCALSAQLAVALRAAQSFRPVVAAIGRNWNGGAFRDGACIAIVGQDFTISGAGPNDRLSVPDAVPARS